MTAVFVPVRVAWRYCAENFHEQLSITDDLPVLMPVALTEGGVAIRQSPEGCVAGESGPSVAPSAVSASQDRRVKT